MTEIVNLVEILLDEGALVGRERIVLKARARGAFIRGKHRAPWLQTAPCRRALRALGRRRRALALGTRHVDLLARRGAGVTAAGIAAARAASTVSATLTLSSGGAATLALPGAHSLAGTLSLALAGTLSLA